MKRIHPATDNEIRKWIAKASSLVGEKEVKKELKEAAKPILKDAKSKVKRHGKPVKRYKNGSVVAVYFPGNLRRSLRLLSHLERKSKNKNNLGIWIGAKLNRKNGSGNFKGNRVDGYYAHMVEKGTVKSKPVGYWRKALDKNKTMVRKDVARRMLRIIRKGARQKGIK